MSKPSVMPAGNVVLRSFESEGVHRHSNPIENYYPLTYRGAVVASKVIYFDIPKDLQLLSIAISSTAVLTDSNSIIIMMKNTQENISHPFVIKPTGVVPFGIVSVFANLPFLMVSPDWKLEITINFSITYLNIWAKEIFIEREILGRI